MFRFSILSVMFLSCVALPGNILLAQTATQVIFDTIDTENVTGGIDSSSEFGSGINLFGTSRRISLVEFVIASVATPRNAKVRIYSNDGDGGSPGSLLGESDFQPVPLIGTPDPLSDEGSLFNKYILDFKFDLTVPDTIIVTIDDDLPPGGRLGSSFARPLVGNTGRLWSRPSGSNWSSTGLSRDAGVMMRIHAAVPEPRSTDLLFACCSLVILKRKRL